jgi:hypothetical protein
MRPCPELGREVIYVAKPGKEAKPESIRTRKYRERSRKKRSP